MICNFHISLYVLPCVFMFIGIANMFKIVSVENFNQINYNVQTAFSIVDLYYIQTDYADVLNTLCVFWDFSLKDEKYM